MPTAFVFAPALTHTKYQHPESHDRLATLIPELEAYNILADVVRIEPEPAKIAQLRRVHTAALIDEIRQVSQRGGGILDHGDTYATKDSYELARLAVGGTNKAVEAVLDGRAQNGLALVRPPGHHAESDHVSGFCLFNNVAAAARHAQATYGVERVLIVDFDVHHGNGTQEIFYYDDSVMFMSVHMFAPFFYPGIGSLNENGVGSGQGFTVNVPLPAHVGDIGYGRVIDELLSPKAKIFNPDLILVSIGFDAHWRDPLASAGLSLTGYAKIVRLMLAMADELCNGRILFVLEGGYLREALTLGILNTLYALTGKDKIVDPLGPMPYPENDISGLLDKLKRHHLLY